MDNATETCEHCGTERATGDAPRCCFEVPKTRMGYLAERFDELKKRAAKLAFAVAIGYTVLAEYELTVGHYTDPATRKRVAIKRPYCRVTVHGESPCFEGWTLAGRFDFQAIPGTVMRAMVPGNECPAEFHNVDATRCDGCGHARRRNDTFLLQHEDGRYVVVGRQCLRDYLGHVSPEHIAWMAEILAELSFGNMEDGGGFWGNGAPSAWDVRDVLAFAAMSVREHGWAPSKADGATRDDVLDLLVPPHPQAGRAFHEAWKRRRESVTASDHQRADNVIAWLGEVDESGDYIYNLKAVAEAGLVTDKTLGIIVSAIVAYDRAMERETNRRERAARDSDSAHVGTVKKRQVWTATVESIRYWDSQWGTTTFIKLRDAAGNVLVWKASNSPEVYRGDVLTFKGTVKSHDTYKGCAQTVLSRCANIEVVGARP